MDYISSSAEQTKQIAAQFALQLKAGDVVAFYGDLGAGKTQFVAGAVEALGYSGPVTSPTFNILSVYDTSPPSAHFDMYRIEGALQLENTGFFDYAGGDYITFIEWAELIEDYLPAGCYRVNMEYSGDTQRKISIKEP